MLNFYTADDQIPAFYQFMNVISVSDSHFVPSMRRVAADNSLPTTEN
jgi:hypothetical protein